MHLYLNKLVLGDILINTQNATRNIEYLHVHSILVTIYTPLSWLFTCEWVRQQLVRSLLILRQS